MNTNELIKRISKYRDAIMGVAILWILLHHSNLNLPQPFFAIKRSGYGGVDIFLFVSGLGCAVSLAKNSDPISFYTRRLKRIYPHYIPVLTVFLLMNTHGENVVGWILNILGNLTGFTMWSMQGLRFNWYMTSIFAFYLLAPLFYEIINRYKIKGFVLLTILSFVLDFCFAPVIDLKKAISRFTIFIIGIEAGVLLVEKEANQKYKKRIASLIYLGGGVGAIALLLTYQYQDSIPEEYYNVFIPCILTTPAIICFWCQLFDVMNKRRFGRIVINILGFCGKISLDIYLLHIVFLSRVGKWIEGYYDNTKPHSANIKNFAIWIVILPLAIVVSYLYSQIIDRVFTGKSKKQSQPSS